MLVEPDWYKSTFSISSHSLFEHDIVRIHSLSIASFRSAYQWINGLEGGAWVILGFLVLRRGKWLNITAIEGYYFSAFLLFGISDFIEMNSYPIWLGVWKVVNVFVLLLLRSWVIRTKYPDSKVY
jgi:uncharacterized membrane protein